MDRIAQTKGIAVLKNYLNNLEPCFKLDPLTAEEDKAKDLFKKIDHLSLQGGGIVWIIVVLHS